MSKQNILKGDIVYVLAGDDKGKQGRVLSIQKSKGRAIVSVSSPSRKLTPTRITFSSVSSILNDSAIRASFET